MSMWKSQVLMAWAFLTEVVLLININYGYKMRAIIEFQRILYLWSILAMTWPQKDISWNTFWNSNKSIDSNKWIKNKVLFNILITTIIQSILIK